MSTIGRRVALLARPGVACDRLRGALADAGADLVLEADPLTLDPATLNAVQAQVVLVALDAQTEEALERLDSALQDPAIEVIFEEAELAARREGWEAARWIRHLAAKLHRHGDVLPPGGESGPAAVVDAGSDWPPPIGPENGSGLDFGFEAVAESGSVTPAEPDVADAGHAFDPLLAEIDFAGDAPMTTVAGIDDRATNPSAAFDPSLDFSYNGNFDTVTADRSVDGKAKRVLELMSTDAEMAAGQRSPDESSGEGLAADRRFHHDLVSLASRIAGMELIDDRLVKGPAQAHGAVLVMAGIGGPDAVRQLLGALPESFPRPVLVQQRLDGGRYDKLVAQMQRATKVQVELAEPGAPAIAGVIYILPAGICIEVSELGIQFTAGGDDVLGMLPSADSAVLLLSGSDPAQVDAVMNHSWAGALVIGQSPDGCYDAAAPSALIARGGDCGKPVELAARLSERWRS